MFASRGVLRRFLGCACRFRHAVLNSKFADRWMEGLQSSGGCAAESPSKDRHPWTGVGSQRTMTKILLVEDSKFLRIATERALARAGYEVSSATDGEEALLLAREKLPDLILLDMLLPKMSGPDVLKALKEDALTKAIPVVVMTGMSQKNAARLQEDGAFGFLEKSALELEKGSEKLLTAVGQILGKLGSTARATSA